jgi:O-antigen ligase
MPFALLPAAGIIIAGSFAAFQKPWIMAILIAAGSYLGSLFYLAEGFILPISLFQLFLFSGFGLYLLHVLYYDSTEINYTGYELPVLLFVALIFLSLIYSPDRQNGLFNAIRFLVLLLSIGFIINTVKSIRVVSYLLIVIALISVALSVYAAMETIFNPQVAVQNLTGSTSNLERGSAEALYQDPNRFAAILFLPAAFTFSVINSELSIKLKAISAICFLIILAGLFSTFSRSGFLSFIVIGLTIVSFFRNWKMASIVGAVGLIVILLVPQLRSVLLINIERVFDALTSAQDDSSGIRVMLGLAGIQMFVDSYFIGVGFDAYSEYFTKYYTLQESIGVYEPHNITYTIMAELGLLGLGFYFFYLYVLVVHAWRNVKLSSTQIEKVVSSTLFATFIAYTLFYQFYGGGLLDSNLMILQGLIFAVYFILSERPSVKEATDLV